VTEPGFSIPTTRLASPVRSALRSLADRVIGWSRTVPEP
jgi:hypothetical protein